MRKVKNPLEMEKNGSILNARDYIISVTLCNQYDPTARETGRRFAKSAISKAYKQIKYIRKGTTTNIQSFSSYMNVVPTLKTRGRWDKYITNGEIEMINQMLNK